MDVMSAIEDHLQNNRHTWLVTGCAGFIGSNLVEWLLKQGQIVIGLDNFSTGHRSNLEEIKKDVNVVTNKNTEGSDLFKNFTFFEGDIQHFETCQKVTKGVDFILHQAAWGSVPRSIKIPVETHGVNVTGHLNMLQAAVQNKVKRFIYASSSSVYGDEPTLPKKEDLIGRPLSPYAVTKFCNEIYSQVYYRTYGIPTVGIRYFNVFGKRQDPNGPYAAVIPRWIQKMLKHENVVIFGDGETSRDFCYIENVIQMNVLSALTHNTEAFGQVFNCAYSDQTTLNELFSNLKNLLAKFDPTIDIIKPTYEDFRPGDIRHSLADIGKSKRLLGYSPQYGLLDGLKQTIDRYYEALK